MIRRLLLFVAIGLLGWSIGLIAKFPADRAVAWFAPSGIQAAGVSGTVWQGRAERLEPGRRSPPLKAVSWDVSAWRLLTGRLVADVRFRLAGIEGDGVMARGFGGGWSGHELALRGPLDRASGLLPGGALAVELRGRLLARLAEVAVEDGALQALDARAQWSDAGVVAPIALELGTVSADVAPADGEPGFRIGIEGSGGQLDIAGELQLQPDGRYDVDLRLTPTADAPSGLRETLGLAAQREGDGFRVRRSGRLPGIGGG